MKNKVLGRGLSSLLKEEIIPLEIIQPDDRLDISLIEANEDQPRKHFDETKIRELADSISNHGLVQPIVVTKKLSGGYNIVAGERRFRACKLVGLKEVPVVVKKLDDKEILEISLIENIQREELTAIEEAAGFQKLIQDHGYKVNELASAVGKSRSHVSNLLRLNHLPDSIKVMISEGQLSMGHARCLVGLENSEDLAKKIIANDLNVRQTEELASNRRRKNDPNSKKHKDEKILDEDLIILAQSLSEKFDTKVVIENYWNGGKISFHYSNIEELDSIISRIKI